MATNVQAVSSVLTPDGQIRRFDIHQMIQHATLGVSFILVVLTGIPLKFHDWAFSKWWIGLWGGVDVTRTIHYIGAWMMVSVGVYHLFYIWYSTAVLKKPFPLKMIPTLKDAVNLFQELSYFVGLRKEMPETDRFNWKEKFDYWAIFWGIPVMAGSGFVLMFPVFFTKFLPGWVVPTALVAHSDEAMLAMTWIVMVHIFFNHFSPSGFPMNKAMFTGKVPAERYRREHKLEYNRIMGIKPASKDENKEVNDEAKAE